MIRLLLDQGLPRSTVELLRAHGWDVCMPTTVGLALPKIKTFLNTLERIDDPSAHSTPTYTRYSQFQERLPHRLFAYGVKDYEVLP